MEWSDAVEDVATETFQVFIPEATSHGHSKFEENSYLTDETL